MRPMQNGKRIVRAAVCEDYDETAITKPGRTLAARSSAIMQNSLFFLSREMRARIAENFIALR